MNQEYAADISSLHFSQFDTEESQGKVSFDNYITPYWYGNLIDSKSKIESLKNLYEAFRSGYISLEDFNQSISEMNDNRPIARSL